VKHYVVACVVAVAMAAIQVSGQTAARVEKCAVAPDRSAKLDVRIPQLIAYQGKLTDSTGRPVDDGSYVMIFSLSADSTGSSFWHETQTVETRGGLFNILLGSNAPISIDAMPQGGCYLGIRVLPSTQEFRRQRIVSVPFAFQADNSDKLQGRDTAAFDSLYISHTDTNAVTSVLISDGTITRADVTPSFTAPYADTADYARLASDSARVAASAHLLQDKDTTALWNAKTLQGKDTTGFVRTGQADAVTSAMIVPNTIVKADVAADFKAPFSDTADYANAAPASDSAGVAGNSHLLQGKDTVQLDASYVNEGQASSITSSMIRDTTVNTAHIRDSAVTALKIATGAVTTGKIAAGAVGSTEIADNSVTSADIEDGTITSTDIATSGVVAGTYGDGYHVPRITVDSVGRLTAATDSTILGAAPTGPAGGDLTGNYPNPTIAGDKVTSAKILDGTVVRADVATNFKAPFADTADYAHVAPASDSARVAGNSHLLQNKDTTALWNAKTLQGKDTTGFVRTGQADAVTSAMIVPNTIVRADVAADFKAPFSDTADYASAAPASDSARVAGNSHLLQNKDTTDLWNAKTLQGKDTTALWNAKTLQGKDTTGFVRTGQADAVTSAMIVPNTIVRADVATSFKAPFADTADYAHVAPASDSARVAGNSHLLQGKDTSALWNAKTLQGKDTTGFVRTGQANAVTSAMIVPNTIVRVDVATDFKAPYSDTADYAHAAPASDSARVAGNSHLLQGKDTTALWNAKTLQGKDTIALWNAKTLQGKDTTALDGRYVNENQANSVTSAMIVPNTIVRADVATSFKAPYSDTADYATSAPASDSARVAGNSHLLQNKDTTDLWNAKTLQGKDTTALWNAKTLQDKDTTALWNAKTLQGKDTTGFVRTDQANAVTSAMIVPNTIVRADVATNFKAPYADTADYAHVAPASDSARVAGNSHLLQNKDTTDLWNAKKLQGKDTTGFVRTGQADAVTSAMIVPNTIVRADVATDFKAPFSDTADYASSAPASDSARVAGNSHLLQNKDTTDLWNAKTLQGKDTTALWNAKTLQGKDTTALWNAKRLQGKDTTGFVRTGQTSSITSGMITDSNVTLSKIERGTSPDSGMAVVSHGSGNNPVWGYPAAVGNISPTTMQSLRFGTVNVDFPSTSGPAFAETTATITGAAVGDLVFLTSTSSFNANFILCATCEVTGADTIRVRAYLPSNTTIDPDDDDMYYVLIKP